ncbi:MAG: lyase family protein, partial [Pyrinomonadaceae bacterium]
MNESKNLWGGRFTTSTDSRFAAFNTSFSFDRLLFHVDICASAAHCGGLAAAGVISSEERDSIIKALESIRAAAEINLEYFDELPSEDVHSFIETRLIQAIGDAGRKLHTGRSRNDQVATALRLWLREEIDLIVKSLHALQLGLVRQAESNADVALPGYTHLQRAQPVLWAHWCLAYYEMLSRDRQRLVSARAETNVMPLGSAALAGTSYEINRQ